MSVSALRAKGPLICLAQPIGLGFRNTNAKEGQRPGSLEWWSSNMCDHPIDSLATVELSARRCGTDGSEEMRVRCFILVDLRSSAVSNYAGLRFPRRSHGAHLVVRVRRLFTNCSVKNRNQD